MDRIEAFDWAVYSHFAFQISNSPGLEEFMQWAYTASGYVGTTALMLTACVLFLAQGKRRSALVAMLSYASAVLLIYAIRFTVPRARPEKAVNWVGPDDMVGSYPAPGIFLFMIDAILIGFAVWNLTPRFWLRALYILVATALSVWVCMSQFVLPIHFLTDAIGGMAGATLIGWIAYRCIEREPAQPTETGETCSRRL